MIFLSGNKSKKLFALRKKKSSNQKEQQNSSSASRSGTLTQERADAAAESSGLGSSSLSSSNPSLNSGILAPSSSGHVSGSANPQVRPVSLPGEVKPGMPIACSLATTPTNTLPSVASDVSTVASLSTSTRDEMLTLAQDIQCDVSNLMRKYTADRDRLKQALETMEYNNNLMGKSSTIGSNSMAIVASLKQSLSQALQQNSMLRGRLQKIHLDSDISDLPMISAGNVETLTRGMNQSLSYSSSCISEFFDAREYYSGKNYMQSKLYVIYNYQTWFFKVIPIIPPKKTVLMKTEKQLQTRKKRNR